MKLDFHCKTLSGNPAATDLAFSWDPATGEVSGLGAAEVVKRASWGDVDAHPYPWSWKLSADPLRSWTDMAAIVGSGWWALPPELAEHYPKQDEEEEPPEKSYFDEDGVYVMGRDEINIVY